MKRISYSIILTFIISFLFAQPGALALASDKIFGVEENAVKEEVGEGLQILRLWFFAHNGFTEDAEALMLKNGVLWSVREDLNRLLDCLGLRGLPELVDEKMAIL